MVVSSDGSFCRSDDFGLSWTYFPFFAGMNDLPLWWIQYSKTGQILVSASDCRLLLSTNNATSFSMKTMPCLVRVTPRVAYLS
jgi:hypothetical protein